MPRSKIWSIESTSIKTTTLEATDATLTNVGATALSATAGQIVTLTCTTIVAGGSLAVKTTVPATKTVAGVPGQIAVNSSSQFLYACIATNTWYRIAVTNTDFN